MKYRFECTFLEAERVYLEIISEKTGKKYIPMTREDDSFVCELDLSPSDIYRYIFVIDDNIRLIDWAAPFILPTEDGQIFSCIAINASGEILTYDFEPSIYVKDFNFCNDTVESGELIYKRAFSRRDEKVCVRIEYKDVIGFHQSSILWYKPNGEFFVQSSGIVWNDDERMDNITEWHYIQISDEMPTGRWKVKFFIDGLYILEDYFVITPGVYGIESGILKTNV